MRKRLSLAHINDRQGRRAVVKMFRKALAEGAMDRAADKAKGKRCFRESLIPGNGEGPRNRKFNLERDAIVLGPFAQARHMTASGNAADAIERYRITIYLGMKRQVDLLQD